MSWPLLGVYAHLVLAVLLVGYALFWWIMATVLSGGHGDAEARRLLATTADSRWPPAIVPGRLRIGLVWVGWVFLALLFVTGGALLEARGISVRRLLAGDPAPAPLTAPLALKLGLVVVLAVGQTGLAFRPSRSWIWLTGVAVVAIVVVSSLL